MSTVNTCFNSAYTERRFTCNSSKAYGDGSRQLYNAPNSRHTADNCRGSNRFDVTIFVVAHVPIPCRPVSKFDKYVDGCSTDFNMNDSDPGSIVDAAAAESDCSAPNRLSPAAGTARGG